MVEHEIQVKILVVIAHALLTGHKTEAGPKLQKKLLQIVDKSLLKLGFAQSWIILQIEKLENVGVLDEVDGLDRSQLFACLLDHGRLIPTRKQALVIQRRDLTVELAARPMFVCGFVHVPSAGRIVLDLTQQAIMCPRQFRTQCVLNWKRQVKASHIKKI